MHHIPLLGKYHHIHDEEQNYKGSGIAPARNNQE
jgi:hypothetical protein